MTEQSKHPYAPLTPDLVMDAIESLGYHCSMQVLALNSYENRVYQVGIEDSLPLIAKFYRPQRWSRDAILEEHQFCFDLEQQDISLMTPLRIDGQSLFEFKNFYFALFNRQGGHAPEISIPDTLYRIGMNIGRIHQLGATASFQHRPSLSLQNWGHDSRSFLLEQSFIPSSLEQAYATLSEDVLKKIDTIFAQTSYTSLRIHGDCHLGNILWRDEKAFFVDFDDCINGPAIQDLWLMLSGDRHQQTSQMLELLEGYEEFMDFNHSELKLIEALRTLRMMKYAAWLANRWDDPAFPMHFPWFNTERYWSEHILELREQFSALDEPPLNLRPY